MTDTPRAAASNATPRATVALAWAIGALIVAVVLALTFPAWRYKVSYPVMLTSTYLLTWGPLVIALIATVVFWRKFLGFRAIDIYLGLMIGVVGRAVGIIIQFFATGRMPASDIILGSVGGVYVFTSVIAPVVIAPLIEEPFFRGLLQGSLGRFLRPWGALIITAVIFTVVHTIADGWSWTLIVTLLVFALLAGYVTQQTKRLAPAIVGHAVFNGLAALITWPW
ncbi:CPBP family intramembrane glutamic endopeptidase [Gryllotalpicola protaetiae]|uniref:CPBP family intramembrane metalloprotease n=1 Tax=Gryllotalpicola protaetiae TaxID=2419771 RepID=A0A387BJZ6_9MICO|nr:type II CAAX endopeptidase family protein [Gryllotalpicola protaetiae]AYG04173.1 CPBP family intramembrane metalloprotease [Gryllotalpicola protaetiae]